MHKRELRQLICSMVIGDGCIYTRPNRAMLCLGHSPKQYDYLKWKVNLIEDIFKKKNLTRRFRHNKVIHTLSNGVSYEGYQAHLEWKTYFQLLHKKIYPKHRQHKKSFEYLLNQMNSPLHLAIWLADDGSEQTQKSKHQDGTFWWCNPYYRIELGNCTEGDVNLVKKWFKQHYDIEPKSFLSKKKYHVIWFKAKDSKKIFGVVSPYLDQIPSMRKKFSLSFVRYWSEKPSASLKRDEDIVQNICENK